MDFWKPLRWIVPKRSKTALVLVQPYTLLTKKEVAQDPDFVSKTRSLNEVRLSRKRSIEDIVSKARKAGAYVAHVTSSDLMWWNLVEGSDYIFVFRANKGYKKLKNEEAARKLSEQEGKYLNDRFSKNTAIEAGTGTPASYSVIAETLVPIFSKKGITRVVVCGGYDHLCLKFFLNKLHDSGPHLELLLPSKFVVRGIDPRSLSEVFSSEGIPVKFSDFDAESLLELF